MRYLRKWQLAVVCLLALALLPFAPAPRGTAQAPGYTVTDLGTLGGGAGLQSKAYGLDDCGRVVGESQATAATSAPFRPFQWKDGVMTDLGTLGGQSGTAYATNQGGTVIGSALTAGSLLHPFVRPSAGPMQDLGTLGGFSAEAQDVNAAGLVVGQSEDGGLQDRAFIWQSGVGMQALTATWGTPIRALGISDAGQIVGSANLPTSGTHAYVTIGGVAVDLGTLPGGTVSLATEVNDSGEVSGYGNTPSPLLFKPSHAFRWKDLNGNGQSDAGEMLDLGTLGGTNSFAYDINGAGQVVGSSEFQTGNSAAHAFVWTSANGLQDLNVLVPGTGWTFRDARAVNNRGQIVGYGDNPDGKTHAFLLTPTNVGPSPCDPTPTPTPMPGTLQFSAPTYTVGEGGGSVSISVSRTGGSDGAVSVNYATSNGTATANPSGDYDAASGTLNFANGETTKTFSINLTDDTLDEADETVNLTLSSPSGGATLGAQTTAVLTITDNDAQPTVQFSAATYSVSESGTAATITVTRAGGTNGGVTVNYATSNGTATAGSDYTAASGTLTFGVGETTKTFNVAISGDTLDESDETVNLALSTPGGGAALGAQTGAVLTITDDDATPTLSITKTVTVVEGNTGSSPATTATFGVKLTGASAQTVTVNYNTANGTATAGSDYTAATGTVTFSPGETGTKNVDISVFGDTTDEPNETFVVSLSSPANATFAVTPDDTFGIATITDDDGESALNIDDVTVTEGNTGTTAATFNVSLLPASGQTVTVNYATSNGTATAGSDYTAASGTLTFAPGETTKTVTVNVNGDTTPEAHETFTVNLTGPTNATVGDGQGLGTVNNDDAALSIGDVSLTEGNSGNKTFEFTVSTPFASVNAVSVNYATADGTATQPGDYAPASGTATITAGQTSVKVFVQVVGDNIYENDETFFVNLSSPTNATISDNQAQGTITNDEAPSLFQFSGGPNFFANESAGTFTFTVTRTGSTAGGAQVGYATADGTATAGSDYTAASGTLTFADGETTKTFSVTIVNDTLDEPDDETINVTLTPGFGASPNPASATLHINDDDAPPTFKLDAATYTVAEGGTVTVTVTRTGGTNAATVNYSTANGTATAGSDYTGVDLGTLSFAQGDTTKTFQIATTNDTLNEASETFSINLLASTGTALGTPSSATVTITDNDAAPTLSFGDNTSNGDVTVAEGEGTASFKVTLSAASGQTVTVHYATANDTATAGSDYSAVSGTLTFNPGETTKFFGVPINNDTVDEPNETFFANLSGAAGATVADGQAKGTITDDDGEPSLTVSGAALDEGTGGTTNATFAVTLSEASQQTVSVSYATSDGTAKAPEDYVAASGTLTFAPGETMKTFNVAIVGDSLDEPIFETFNVNLSSPVNAAISNPQGQCTIIDDDDGPAISIGDVSIVEGNSGATYALFAVTLSGISSQEVSVAYHTADGTATAGSDYVQASGLVSFGPGETSKTIGVEVNGDTANEADETFFVNLSGTNNPVADAQGRGTILDDDTPRLGFSLASFPAAESAHFVTVTVTRAGNASAPVSVDFATSDGTATERKDYTAVSGRLQFAAGETSKSFDVLLTEDSFTEPEETINLTLSNPTGGASLGAQASATVRIAADDNPPPGVNPIDVSSDFVRQHYHDFLNREPDASGLNFWTHEIEQCGADAGCREVKRVNVSAAFFLSIEFQQTGYLVYRTYKAAYGDATSPNVEGTVPVVRLQEFLPDTKRIGDGVIVGEPNWDLKLEANKNAYMADFVQRQRFLTAFPASMTPGQVVDKLNQNAGGVLDAAERQSLVNELTANNTDAGRASVLRKVAEDAGLVENEKNRAFVLMQYFGYLRRNPDDPQDTDFRGWKFWLTKLNEANGNFVQAEMVKAFLDSIEYRTRFAP